LTDNKALSSSLVSHFLWLSSGTVIAAITTAMSSTSTASKPPQSINTTFPQSTPTDQSKLSAASPQAASRPRPTHSASHIRQRSIELKDIVTSSPTARRMSMSSTPQDVTDRGEGVVARSLRYAEWVVAGLCAWSLLYVPGLIFIIS